MNKYRTTTIIACLLAAVTACHSSKPIIAYTFPEAMAPQIREGYTAICEKGRLLYDKNCARCHNTLVKGKKIIPDFSQEKLIGYSIRVSNARHETAMPDSIVTEEELGQIMTFLTFKPKNKTFNN